MQFLNVKFHDAHNANMGMRKAHVLVAAIFAAPSSYCFPRLHRSMQSSDESLHELYGGFWKCLSSGHAENDWLRDAMNEATTMTATTSNSGSGDQWIDLTISFDNQCPLKLQASICKETGSVDAASFSLG